MIQTLYLEVLPNTESFRVIVLDDDALHLQAEGEEDAEWMIYEGLNAEGISTGFAIPGAEAGYQDIISALFGYDAVSQKIIGFKVLDSKETPGLGDKIYKDDAFQLNFNDLSTDPDVLIVKKGEKNADNQVEAITGATISSNAIGRLINASLKKWKQPIADYSNNPKNESHD
ncbi:MAG TPA: hypothetical protein DCR48_00370 [Flavobacteriales bacterium]|jgi:Na+-translocating ferredoxin:NAD+ oxidoreductase subunit G|nr:hypothetical protein [Flavobacteriales bacterium]